MSDAKPKIDLLRSRSADALSRSLADPADKADTGTAAAAAGALAASLLNRAARLCPPKEEGSADAAELDWLLRNSEILRGYFLHLMDEDVRCRGPLRRALDEGDPRKIEAARQSAVAVCGEVINMSGQCLDLCVRLLPFCDASAAPYVLSAADLAHGAGRAAVPYILRQGDFSTDETYRYVLRRENELTLRQQQTAYDSIRAALA